MSAATKVEKPKRSERGNPASVEIFPGIKSTPGVCGGDPCVGDTRIAAFILVELKRLGSNDEQILDAYPTLTQRDLNNAWAYERAHRKEIDAQIAYNNSDDDD